MTCKIRHHFIETDSISSRVHFCQSEFYTWLGPFVCSLTEEKTNRCVRWQKECDNKKEETERKCLFASILLRCAMGTNRIQIIFLSKELLREIMATNIRQNKVLINQSKWAKLKMKSVLYTLHISRGWEHLKLYTDSLSKFTSLR